MKKFLFILYFVLLLTASGWGAECWVDFTNGSDSNAGTEAAPFKHCPCSNLDSGNSGAFCTSLAAGDIINLKAGETWENTRVLFSADGSDGTPITLRSYGSGADPIITANTSYAASDFTGPDGNGEYYIGSISNDPGKAWNGSTLLTEGTAGSLGDDEWGYDAGNSRVYFKPSAALSTYSIQFSTQEIALYHNGANWWEISDIELQGGYGASFGSVLLSNSDNNVFTDVSFGKSVGYGAVLNTSDGNSFIRPIVSVDSSARGLRASGCVGVTITDPTVTGAREGLVIYNTTSAVLSGGTVSDGAGSSPKGVYAYGTSTGSISDMTIRDFDTVDGSDGIFLESGATFTVEDNTISNIADAGVHDTGSSSDIVGNHISDCWDGSPYDGGEHGFGIRVLDGFDGTVSRNTVAGCYLGVRAGNVDATFSFNKIVNSLVNCFETDSVAPNTSNIINNDIYHDPDPDVVTDNGHALIIRTDAATKQAVIRNNVIYMTARMDGIDGLQIDDTTDNVTLSNNRYYSIDNGYSVNLLYYNSTNYDSDFSGWETATGDSDSAISKPEKASLKDLGVAVSGINGRDDLDINGRYPYGPVDIGAKQTWGSPAEKSLITAPSNHGGIRFCQ